MIILTTSRDFSRQLICYEIKLNDQSFYIGLDTMRGMSDLSEARSNNEWHRLVKPTDTICVTTLATFRADDRNTGISFRDQMINLLKPHCNCFGHATTTSGTSHRVRNINTGREYATMSVAAREAGVTRQAMAQHIAGEIKRIGGHHYERII